MKSLWSPLSLIIIINITLVVSSSRSHKNDGNSVSKVKTISKRSVTNYCEQVEILNAHNSYRAIEGASNMKKLKWRKELAIAAEEYAKKCIWQHGDMERDSLPYKHLGQNLYTSTLMTSYRSMVDDWYNEKKWYNFDKMTCVAGQMCGHYTQVVWANTSEIGCAFNFCPVLKRPNDTDVPNQRLVVCDYGPSGNYINVPLYTKGNACDKCDSAFPLCDNQGLCVSNSTDSGGNGEVDNSGFCASGSMTLYADLVFTTMLVVVTMVI